MKKTAGVIKELETGVETHRIHCEASLYLMFYISSWSSWLGCHTGWIVCLTLYTYRHGKEGYPHSANYQQ